MAVFGTVPGLTIFSLGVVMVMGFTYVVTAVYITHSPNAARTWRMAIIPITSLFFITTFLVLLSTIAESQFVSHVTGN